LHGRAAADRGALETDEEDPAGKASPGCAEHRCLVRQRRGARAVLRSWCRDLVLVRASREQAAVCRPRLEAAHPVRERAVALDLPNSRTAQAPAAAMRRHRVALDVLVNAAGIAELGQFASIPAARSPAVKRPRAER
jgi:NAD(P)-dependent dehydrogenase (short-subunit alcohol dehydrogenase family)